MLDISNDCGRMLISAFGSFIRIVRDHFWLIAIVVAIFLAAVLVEAIRLLTIPPFAA